MNEAEPKVRFGLAVDKDDGHHVHFRVFAATGGQHLGLCGALVMTADEYAVFRDLVGLRAARAADWAIYDLEDETPRCCMAGCRCGEVPTAPPIGT
jgi:hypothetical protein